MVESPWREASSPRILSNGAEIHTTLWHFWRVPPRSPADPYRTGHWLHSNSPLAAHRRLSKLAHRG
jgi:hypothetical protein